MHMIFFFQILLLISIISRIETSILHKIRTFLTGGKGKAKPWEFVATSEIEYPGNNLEKKKVIQEMWSSYYNCLTSHNEIMGPYKSIKPEALMVFEGTSVKLECKVCVHPEDITRTDDVQWNYREIPPTVTKLVELGEHKFLSPQDKVLQMYDLSNQDTGQYFCQRGQTVTSAYFLEVVNNSEPTLEVQPEESQEGPYPHNTEFVLHARIQISTTWTKWSKCSTCGIIGKRVRYGICTVKPFVQTYLEANISNLTHKEEMNETHKSFVNQTKGLRATDSLKINNPDIKQFNDDSSRNTTHLSPVEKHPVFNLFYNGIPCRSQMLPRSIFIVPEVQMRKSEIMVGLCKEPCPDSTVFQVVDEKGHILETANNSAGEYSTLQGVPREPPEVQRLTIFEDTLSKRIVLKCPGNMNSDAPIQWQIGSFNIDSVTVYVLSHGRIFINILDQIVITQPQAIDSNIYSCWQSGELAGTIRLIVEKKLELDFNQHIMLLSMVMVLGTFVLVFFRAFRARNRLPVS